MKPTSRWQLFGLISPETSTLNTACRALCSMGGQEYRIQLPHATSMLRSSIPRSTPTSHHVWRMRCLEVEIRWTMNARSDVCTAIRHSMAVYLQFFPGIWDQFTRRQSARCVGVWRWHLISDAITAGVPIFIC